ncbi:MAG: MerR family transcriptional regulator [Clostridia bacterium]|nr:MerR family transcriptional regulator [Clostridia bacterium]
MMTVNEVSKLTGVSVRTLHYYDEIKLLKPTCVTKSGYRLYDDTAIKRLSSILFFRELKFSLKEIKEIIESENFDTKAVLTEQIKLLQLQYDRLGKLISYAREIMEKGENIMNFNAFDNSEIENYKNEAKQKWGNTSAYKEYEERGTDQNADGLMQIFESIGKLKNLPANERAVQSKIAELKKFITDNYYTCTDEILKGLSEMYVSDERFKKNIDGAGGDGTAEFVRNAILVYCNK